MSDVLLVEDTGAVRVLTLNRPQARNALSGDLITALYRGLLAADADPEVRAVVVTGADPGFCAGVDLRQAAAEGRAYFSRFETEDCVAQVAAMRTPVIAAVNGPAFTGGFEIALGCDFIVASERASFGDTHVRVGVLPGGGLTARLPRLVGSGTARRISMVGEVIDAARAERIGLVTEVVPHERLLERVIELATAVAEVPAQAMRGLKEIYVTGGAAVVDPARAAEKEISTRELGGFEELGARRAEVTARNRRQLANAPDHRP